MTRFLALGVCMVILSSFAFGQHKRLLHQTFEIPDSLKEIHLDVFGTLNVESWSGNVMMSEIQVEVEKASQGLFNHLIKTGRYQLLTTNPDTSVVLIVTSKISKLDSVTVRVKKEGTETVENVKVAEKLQVKVFMPDIFEPHPENPLIWTRKPEESDNVIKALPDSTGIKNNNR
jgi:hypothetical protein